MCRSLNCFFCMALSCVDGCDVKPLVDLFRKVERVSAHIKVHGSFRHGRKQGPLPVDTKMQHVVRGHLSANSRIDQQNGSRIPGHDLQIVVREVAKSAEAQSVRQTTVARAIETVSALPTRRQSAPKLSSAGKSVLQMLPPSARAVQASFGDAWQKTDRLYTNLESRYRPYTICSIETVNLPR